MDSYPRIGLEWAEDLEDAITDELHRLPCIELIPENFFDGRHQPFLKKLQETNIPVLVHAVEVSFGTAGSFRKDHLDKCLRVMEQVNTLNFSDHLCMTEAGGIEIGQLTPIPWNQEMVDLVCHNVDYIQSRIDVPFLIENVTNRFLLPNQPMSETEFINAITRRTGCGLLLDITNVYTNATNFGFDPVEWFEQIDYKSVSALHLAGGYYDDEGALVDSHSRKVPDAIWDLFGEIIKRVHVEDVIVEWTEDTPPIEEIFSDLKKAEEIVDAQYKQHKPTLIAAENTL